MTGGKVGILYKKRRLLMEIKSASEARRAMTIAFKLMNKSINYSRLRRVQCVEKAERLIAASEKYVKANTPQP